MDISNSVSEQEFVDFLTICLDDDLKKIKGMLIENPKLINTRNSLGETVLHILAINGKLDALKYLYSQGAAINITDYCGASPLSDAVSLGKKDVVGFLLHQGANVKETYEMGNSILHEAIKSGDLEIIRMLIDYGADIFQKNDLGENLLHISMENREWDTITKFLIEKDLNPKEKDVFGNTPLDNAAAERNNSIIEYVKYALTEGRK